MRGGGGSVVKVRNLGCAPPIKNARRQGGWRVAGAAGAHPHQEDGREEPRELAGRAARQARVVRGRSHTGANRGPMP